jgi:hypothetical protein
MNSTIKTEARFVEGLNKTNECRDKKQDGVHRATERSRWLSKKNLGKKINNDDILEISTECFLKKMLFYCCGGESWKHKLRVK